MKDFWTRKNETQVIVETLTNAFLEKARIDADVQGQLITGLVRSNDNMSAIANKLVDTLPTLATITLPNAEAIRGENKATRAIGRP